MNDVLSECGASLYNKGMFLPKTCRFKAKLYDTCS